MNRCPVSTFVLISLLSVFVPGVSAESQSVKTAPIIKEYVDLKIRTFGVLAPKVEEMSFQIPGRISTFSVEEGARVKAGELLVALETTDAEDQLRKAKAELDNVKRIRDRMQTLQETGSIQVSQLEEAQAHYSRALFTHGQAQLNLDRCALTAPTDGVILKQVIDSRTSVAPGQTIFIFQSDDEQWVTKVDLTDKNALLMSAGARAEVLFSPYPNDIFKGEVTRVAQVANQTDGLYTAEITIKTEGRELRPGMVAEVDLIKTSEREYSIVPFDALLDLRKQHGNIYVASEDGTKALEKKITVNAINGDSVSLLEDLAPYTRVITRGHHGLQNESAIVIAD